jgi:uncharacterized protein (TIGR03083 family)
MPGKHEIVRAAKAERRRTLSLLRTLDPPLWDTPTALPRWRVREVVAHLITVDRGTVTGTLLPAVFSSPERLEAWNERKVYGWVGNPISDLLTSLERWGRWFARSISLLPSAIYRVRLPSVWGLVSGGTIVHSRIYDEWVHRQDIRRAIGMADEDVDLAPAAEFVLAAMETAILPNLDSASGRIWLSLEGAPIGEMRWELTAPDASPLDNAPEVRIESPAHSFVMAAARRDSFDDLARRGALRIEGDERLAHDLLEKLWIV